MTAVVSDQPSERAHKEVYRVYMQNLNTFSDFNEGAEEKDTLNYACPSPKGPSPDNMLCSRNDSRTVTIPSLPLYPFLTHA